MKKERSKAVRIAVLVLVVVVAAGLFLFKNAADLRSVKELSVAGQDQYSSNEFDLNATADFDLAAILSHEQPVIVDFGADSCVPCKEMAPILDELNQELRGQAVVKFVDVWKNPSAGQVVPLEVIPTQFFFNADGSPYVPADPEAAAKKGFILYKTNDTGKHVFTAHQGGLDKETILSVLKEMGMQ